MLKKKYDPKIDGITQSLLATYQFCPKRFWYNIQLLSGLTSNSMEFGTLFHTVLEWCYNGNALHLFDIDVYEFPKEIALKDQEYMRTVCVALVTGYLKHWEKEEESWTNIVPELLLDTEWYGYRLRGKIDGVITIGEDTWLLETKTKSQVNEDGIQNRLALDWQSQFYILAYTQQYGVIPKGVIYNVVRYPKRAAPNLKEFSDKLTNEIAKTPDYFFYRWKTEYSADDMHLFAESLFHKLNQLDLDQEYYRSENACEAPYLCNFINACATGDLKTGLRHKKVLFEELMTKTI